VASSTLHCFLDLMAIREGLPRISALLRWIAHTFPWGEYHRWRADFAFECCRPSPLCPARRDRGPVPATTRRRLPTREPEGQPKAGMLQVDRDAVRDSPSRTVCISSGFRTR
jgi:hypothetical protein